MKTNTLDFDAQALRDRILDLAMRGKLVPQDPNDEPASVLLEKIKAEKAELVKEKKIKKSKPLPEITDDEKPFDIPDSWEWVRAIDITSNIGDGLHGTPVFNKIGYPFINGSNFINDKITITENTKFVSQEEFSKYKIPLNKGTVFISLNGTLGKVALYNNEKIILGKSAGYFNLINPAIRPYFAYYLRSSIFKKFYDKKYTGSIIKNIPLKALRESPVPLPPLSEQSRIAAKIAQLFALLRKVESSTQQYAKLQTLLKSKVLDLAMRGKLVKQDPNDEPASVLLEKIKAEKAELVKEKKIKKSKPLPPITDGEKPFDIPDSWEWVRLGDVLTILRGGSPRPIKKYLTNDPDGINWIKIGDSSENSKYIDHAAEKIIPEGLSKTRIVHKGDFLLSNSMSFGRPYILKINGAVHDGWLILSNYESIFNKDYLYYLLLSRFISKQFSSLATGSTVKNLNRERVSNTVALHPPLSEQSRIAAKIAQLFALLRKVESLLK
ncbi:restriction endonuclease subunit S [Lactobacillus gallinarum]|uniref:restriction endonuclease subunit S n=1 Tax=Lactobacillus gallinarum TaxID=52242 RepID=UPI00195BC673|nr:restriction endonuclease subunit S [Lactobacillus gallinarum]MBM6973183.1 restriction endonuclease subunit S [Lactobacillus gallinarum]